MCYAMTIGGDGVKIRIVAAIVLAAMVGGLFWLSMEKREQYRQELAVYEEAAQKMEQQALLVQEKQARLEALTTEKADRFAADAKALEQEAALREQEILALQAEIDTLQETLDSLSGEAQAKQEEMDYLDQVYQALQEGYEKVKGYIAGN